MSINITQSYGKYKDSGITYLGSVPAHWEIKHLKNLAEIRGGKDSKEVEIDEGGYPIYGSGGVFGRASKFLYKKPSILLGRKGTIDKPLFVTEAFWSVDTMFYTAIKKNVDPKYLYYKCLTIPFGLYQYGSAVPSMASSVLSRILFAIPKQTEQIAISEYLDTKSSKIDSKIDLLSQKVACYEKLKQTLINETVTHGLNKTVTMKDSGIDWIGRVPSHWDVKPIRNILENRIDKNVGNTESEYLSLVAGTGVIPYAEKGNVGNKKPEDLEKCRMVFKGDFVLNSMNFGIGSFGISRYNGVCSSVYIVMRPKNGVNGEYLYRLFQIKPFQKYMSSFGKGIMEIRMAIKWEHLKNIELPIPPTEEQKAIADYLDEKTVKIDQILTAINAQIEKLKEIRKTLINDVVTGKIKVTDEGLAA